MRIKVTEQDMTIEKLNILSRMLFRLCINKNLIEEVEEILKNLDIEYKKEVRDERRN